MPAIARLLPAGFVLKPTIWSLILGTAGGAVFAWFQLPLAWMIGAMVANIAVSFAGVPVAIPPALRTAMIMVLGILLGSAFTPALLDRLGLWTVTLAGLLAYSLAVTGIGLVYLRLVSRRDAATSFFTAAPGGLNEMVIVGTQMGGDERFISAIHGMRVMLVVIAIPFWFQLFENYSPSARGGLGPSLFALELSDLLLLGSCVLGAAIAKPLRLPAAALTGPMIVSAAIHLAGLTTTSPPGIFVGAAQVVVGAALGSRFTGISFGELGRIASVGVGLTAIMVGVSVAFALVLHRVTGFPVATLVLAYVPGGLAEMSLVALALGLDAPFVATHHIVRVLLIVVLWPVMYAMFHKLLVSRRGKASLERPGED